MRSRAFRTALLCAAVAAGCARHDADDAGQKAGKKPREMTEIEVMERAARATWKAPADGQITEEQVRQYLDVKRRARQIQTEKPASREPSVTIDLRAALELGYNPKELSWVEERVLEAWIALRGQELDRKLAEARKQVLRDLEAQRKGAANPQQRKELEKEIADIRAAAPLPTEAAPAVDHNTALVRRYESDVARTFAEERGPQETRNER
jgi:hypothetical protein